jgi:hypothetical protein
MKKNLLWLLAFIITVASAVYQRRTGPTYPVEREVTLAGIPLRFSLPRSADTGEDAGVSVSVPNPEVTGRLLYKRYKTEDAWSELPMTRQAGGLVGYLPQQPESGKLAYRVILSARGQDVPLSGDEAIVLRFKGHVPLPILLGHVLVMFAAMLLSTRAGLAALDRKADPRVYRNWTVVLLFLGGFVFGPLVQKLAFGTWWTGVPNGWDLTDNKTLIALVFWIIALVAGRGGRRARAWTVAAAALMLVVFMIPHSLFGSELRYPAPGR